MLAPNMSAGSAPRLLRKHGGPLVSVGGQGTGLRLVPVPSRSRSSSQEILEHLAREDNGPGCDGSRIPQRARWQLWRCTWTCRPAVQGSFQQVMHDLGGGDNASPLGELQGSALLVCLDDPSPRLASTLSLVSGTPIAATMSPGIRGAREGRQGFFRRGRHW